MSKTIAKKIIDEKSYEIKLVTSVNKNGEDFYAFVMIPAQYNEALDEMLKTQNVDLKEFCIILASGKGHNPSDEVRQKVLAKYAV